MPASRVHRVTGFTLIEILIVIVIIGSLASLAVLNLGGADRTRQLETEARRLHAVLRMAAEEAVFQAEEYGLLVQSDGYQFVRLDPGTGRWLASAGREFEPHVIAAGFEMRLQVEGEVPALAPQKQIDEPAVLLLSSGEVTPFLIEMRFTEEEGRSFLIASDGFSDIELLEDDPDAL